MPSNLERLQSAYAAWHETKGANIDEWAALMAEEVHFGAPRAVPEVTGDLKRRSEVLDYLGGILKQWEMEYFRPAAFVEDGGRIAMFGQCAYRNRATGKLAEIGISHLWEFEDGKIVRMAEIFDTARAAGAATPDRRRAVLAEKPSPLPSAFPCVTIPSGEEAQRHVNQSRTPEIRLRRLERHEGRQQGRLGGHDGRKVRAHPCRR